jgi:hypothetical protein
VLLTFVSVLKKKKLGFLPFSSPHHAPPTDPKLLTDFSGRESTGVGKS